MSEVRMSLMNLSCFVARLDVLEIYRMRRAGFFVRRQAARYAM